MAILLIILATIILLIDGNFASPIIILLTIICGWLSCNKIDDLKDRKDGFSVLWIVSFVYFISSYVVSRSFENGGFFFVLDPITYTPYLNLYSSNVNLKEYLEDCYWGLSDSNALHESYVSYACIIANRYLGGATILFETYLHTIFGILSNLVLYRILLLYFPSKKAKKYTLLFAFLSPFFYYSTVIIRDIVISYFYIRGIEIVLKKFGIINLLLLILFFFVTWGCRLYSGFFYSIFIAYYIYINFKDRPIGKICLSILTVLGLIIISAGILENAVDQSIAEINTYETLDIERGNEIGGGLSYKLLKLPNGIRQIVLFFYSQIFFFPFFSPIGKCSSFIELFSAIIASLYPLFWYFVSYSLMIYVAKFKALKRVPFEFILLLGFSVVFIVLNTAHIDPRRMMPMYPIVYLMFLICKDFYLTSSQIADTKRLLSFMYCALLCVYFVLR